MNEPPNAAGATASRQWSSMSSSPSRGRPRGGSSPMTPAQPLQGIAICAAGPEPAAADPDDVRLSGISTSPSTPRLGQFRKPIESSPSRRRRTPGTTSLSIPRHKNSIGTSGIALASPRPIFSTSVTSPSPISVVTPTSAFSTTTPTAATSSASANGASTTAPSITSVPYEPLAFSMEDEADKRSISVSTAVTSAAPTDQREQAGAPIARRKNRNLSVSTNHSLSISNLPPPTSVLWAHSALHLNADEPRQADAPIPVGDAEGLEQGRLGELKRFTLWETKTRFYLVAFNTSKTRFRILKIDRTPPIALAQSNAAKGSVSTSGGASSEAAMKKPLEGADGLASQDLPRRDLANEHAKNARSRVSQAAASASQPDEAVCNIDPSMLSASGERYLTANTADMVMLQRPTDAKSSTLSELASAPRLNLGGTGRSTAPHPGKETTGSNFSFPPNERKDASYSTTRLAKSSFSAKPSGTSSYHEHTGRSRDDDADWEMNVVADSVVYTRTQIEELLEMLREGNKASGGLKEMGRFYGIVGFIRFTSTYYMVLISKRSVVALLGGHYVFHCDETKIVPICDPGMLASLGGRSKVKEQEETRLLATFKQVDLSKNFYFSYTYDLTKTLQDNLTSKAEAEAGDGHVHQDHRQEPLTAWGFNEKFVWNHHLLMPAFGSSVRKGAALGDGWYGSEWVLPLVYGFVDQAKLSVLNRTIYVTLIARRSRHFAGARFLKRGVTDRGQVANDVETEQIVNEPLTSPFFAPGTGESSREGATYQPFIPSPRFTSYVMHRGSIPIYWTQDSTNMSPRPPIEISVVDPYYSAAALHFDDMFRRYGAPVIILNLIKSKEKQPREVKLLRAFGECVNYLNQFLPEEKKLKYIAWDMSRASKSRDQDVIGVLEDIAEETIENTKFFHSGPEPASFAEFATESTSARREQIQVQSGVARVNCVDCLDRTNAAQFVIGKAAFGHQLHALGLLDHPTLPFDSDAVNMLTEMYHDLGDTIALQYGGSHLVNTMETYRKINQWSSHSRDMLEGIKRYYANSFVDAEKQAAINLFLGVDAEMPETNRLVNVNNPRYQKWFIPQHLGPHDTVSERIQRLLEVVNSDKGFWAEYYRPRLFTDMARHHAYKMTAVHQHHPMTPMHQTNHIPISPSSIQQTQVIVTSPFVNKYAPAAIGRHNQSSSSGLFEENNRAIIGGVRRWMSINKAGAGPVTKRKRSKMYASGEDGRAEISINEKRDKTGATGTGAAAGLAAEIGLTASAATGPAGAFPAFEVALCRIQMPTVSAEEASEYEWYATQFADVSFSQTHHVDEADVAMYEDGAAVAAGAVDKVASLLVGGAGQSREGEKNAQLDPVLLAYANALPGSKALISKLEKVSDAKIRAYSNWLQSHVPK